jgi:hypothetical protein
MAMGLLRGVARTAVVAGTATAVSNRVSRRQARRWQQDEYEQAQYAAPQYAGPQSAAPQYAAPQSAAPQVDRPPDAGGNGVDGLAAQLERLAELKSQGLITDEEFAAAKAKLLAQ